ncbi:MAG: tRNA preQ1(34) S-adenosylmethionine ribosyltransferase-isomerase QueA [Candidatus Brocadia sp. UTAMX2]|jgi:S-adenosylmethionine:tRNA ribosyltransferase-isomerase|nr:MAG: tRNA preQ1(34) S-adenosylmethionine ribosyltransferase-isomerase QueA [Candidatus Brocadia sp. UTAMX2]
MDFTALKPVSMCTKLSDYEYDLPKELIAQQPLENREDARLLILYRNSGKIEHRRFYEIIEYLCPGDFLVLNNTKVIPALLSGKRISGASLELLLTEEREENQWKALIKSNAKLKAGEEIYITDNILSAKLLKKGKDGSWLIQFDNGYPIKDLLLRTGKMPLPPYIKRPDNNEACYSSDKERYQTVFAQKEGAIAAPTAGLHFSHSILERIKKYGAEIGFVTLHAGMGTFLPIKTDDIRKHQMHKEYYECPREIMDKIKETKGHRHRVIAVGSTSCRVLESVAMHNETPQTSGWTNLFIYPPYHFRYVDVLLTNFHLPRTTLLALVCAFAGRENILNAYEIAKNKGYRFFSYGDCMMIM